MSNLFGWSYPPGCSGTPFDEEPYPIQLHEGRTLKGYWCADGLNGKDADLDYGGQNVVTEAYWFEDDTIRVSGRRYASIVPNEEASEEQMDLATEIVCGEGYAGEWDGDYWVMGEDYDLTGTLTWNDELTDEANIEAATAYCFDLIAKDSTAFENAMTELSKAVGAATATGD